MSISRGRVGILATACFAAALTVWFERWSLDGVEGVALSAVLAQDTAYADGYSDRAFRSARVSMSGEQK